MHRLQKRRERTFIRTIVILWETGNVLRIVICVRHVYKWPPLFTTFFYWSFFETIHNKQCFKTRKCLVESNSTELDRVATILDSFFTWRNPRKSTSRATMLRVCVRATREELDILKEPHRMQQSFGCLFYFRVEFVGSNSIWKKKAKIDNERRWRFKLAVRLFIFKLYAF